METAERELLAATVDEALAGVDGDRVDAVLGDLGWFEMLESERRDAVAIVFRALGATNGMGSILDDVLVAALGLPLRAGVAVVLPQFATWAPPGTANDAVAARGLATRRVTTTSELLVACADATRAVATTAAEVQVVTGVDPGADLYRVRMEGAPARLLGAGAWDAAVAWARFAIAHQIAGACHTMLDLARTHALEREQFGRPIARFQAVRHRLAEALVAIEALDAALAAVDDGDPMAAALAKAVAGRTAGTVAAHCQQILAGIGFTTDHPFHRFFKRTMTLDGLFGSARTITLDLGRHLLATRRVPHVIEL